MLLLKLEDIMRQIKTYKEETSVIITSPVLTVNERIIFAFVVIPLFCFAPNEMNYKELNTVNTTTFITINLV